MHISCAGVQLPCLFGNGINHMRVIVANMGNVVIAIQVTVTLVIIQPNTFTANNMKGLIIK